LVQFKLVVSDPRTGKAQAIEVKDENASLFIGRRIGELVDSTPVGVAGKIMITGGSDRAGFPMRADVLGGGKNYVLMTEGVGFKSDTGGTKKRKLVRGSTINEEIYQINARRAEEAPPPASKP
jgi:small subunit ribosomal protein S6e